MNSEDTEGILELLVGTAYAIFADHNSRFLVDRSVRICPHVLRFCSHAGTQTAHLTVLMEDQSVHHTEFLLGTIAANESPPDGHSIPRATSRLLTLLVSPNAVRERICDSQNHLWLSKRLRHRSTCTNGVFGRVSFEY